MFGIIRNIGLKKTHCRVFLIANVSVDKDFFGSPSTNSKFVLFYFTFYYLLAAKCLQNKIKEVVVIEMEDLYSVCVVCYNFYLLRAFIRITVLILYIYWWTQRKIQYSKWLLTWQSYIIFLIFIERICWTLSSVQI